MIQFIGDLFPYTSLTPEGGYYTWVVNDTGVASVKGTVVHASSNVDRGVSLVPIDDPDPCGVVYDSGVPQGGIMRVVISGIAEVLYSTPVNRGTFARVPIGSDPSATPGQAIAEPLPSPPFATDKHFLEVGHPVQTIASPGLALTVLHFN
ncbi:hypothetical protein AMJ80_02450 [bacterium SM23_31]|nr:MAG: hypothetical protein AMJ80_02450 [bacterium SM23_31]